MNFLHFLAVLAAVTFLLIAAALAWVDYAPESGQCLVLGLGLLAVGLWPVITAMAVDGEGPAVRVSQGRDGDEMLSRLVDAQGHPDTTWGLE